MNFKYFIIILIVSTNYIIVHPLASKVFYFMLCHCCQQEQHSFLSTTIMLALGLNQTSIQQLPKPLVSGIKQIKNECIIKLIIYEAYSESKYCFAVKKKSTKVSYKMLLLPDSTFFKLFLHIFAAIIEALIVAGHKFLYTLLIECGRR